MNLYSHLVAGAVAARNDIQIQTSVRYLFVKISGGAATVTEAEMKAALLSWSKAGKSGTEAIQNKISLYALAEVNAAKEGLFLMNATSFECIIEIGDGGALQCGADNYLSLNFEGFQTDWNVDIFAISDPVISTKCIKYVLDNIANKTQADIDLRGVKALLMPVAAVSKLYLNYATVDGQGKPGTRSIQLLAEELRAVMFLSNEIVNVNSLTAASSIVVVSEEYYAIDVKDAVNGYIEYNAGQTSAIVYLKSETF